MKKLIGIIAFTIFISIQLNAQEVKIEVKGAGTEKVNGIYMPEGKFNGKSMYVHGEYSIIYKGCQSKWMIIGPDGNYYRNMNDTELPPDSGWKKGCAEKSTPPFPHLTIMKLEDN
ncbi:MAG: hypothetical protein JXB49_11420 [Bacteroidales bacterium]|nr:hypothetical protein [Bacteroidales bacterium]